VALTAPVARLSSVSPEPQSYPWPPGTATGIGSMPGTDPAATAHAVLKELPDFPHLAELPARGPGADLVGRTAAMLVGLAVETTTGGWRFTPAPGRDHRRAVSMLARDLDELEQAAEGWDGPLKVQACGPWTMAASIELSRSSDPSLSDPGAIADLTASLAEGMAAHLAEVRKRVPGATVLLQLDEPSLPAALDGAIASASGLNRVREVDAAAASAGLQAIFTAAGAFGVVHCCAPRVPFKIISDAGAGAVSFDLSLLRRDEEDGLAEAAESGLGMLIGATKVQLERGHPGRPPAPRDVAARVTGLGHRMGVPPAALAGAVVITPSCGLAGASPAGAREVLARCREAARILPELIEEG
jgi:Cobalamin-independent synthase, Catalytic domain